MSAVDVDERATDGFRHEALLYAGDGQYLAGTMPFIEAGLAAGEAILVVVPEPRLRSLRDAMGRHAARVQFADMAEVGRNPARIIPAWRRFLDEHGGRRPVRGIGEPITAERSAPELVEYQGHEALLNVAFADSGPWQLLCPYDVATLHSATIDEARRSHPWIRDGDRRVRSGVCRDLAAMAEPFDGPLPPAPDAAVFGFGAADLRAVRAIVASLAREAGLPVAEADDLVLAVDEIATNSIRYGGGVGTLRVWRDGDSAVCEVTDTGRIHHPLAGRVLPSIHEPGGRGLWLANQLCDLVQIRTHAGGNVVRVHRRRR